MRDASHLGLQRAAAPVPSAKATSSARSPATIPALRLPLLPLLLLLFLHNHLVLLLSNTTTIPSSKRRAKRRSRALRAGLLTLLRSSRSVARTRIWRILSAGVGGDCSLILFLLPIPPPLLSLSLFLFEEEQKHSKVFLATRENSPLRGGPKFFISPPHFCGIFRFARRFH